MMCSGHFRPRVSQGRSLGFTLVELLVVITIIGILIALLLPAVQMAREAARKAQCSNSLKQLTLAALQHEEVNKFYPSGGWGYWWVGDPDRGPGKQQPGGWLYSILPYLEQMPLYRLGSDGNAQSISAAQKAGALICVQTPLAAMNCPTRRTAVTYPIAAAWYGGGSTAGYWFNVNGVTMCARGDYATCVGDNDNGQWGAGPGDLASSAGFLASTDITNLQRTMTGVCYLASQVSVAMVTDGTSNTYMIGERYLDPDCYYNGMDGADNESMYVGYDNDTNRSTYCPVPLKPNDYVATPMQDTPGSSDGLRFGSAHAGSCNMSFCDGSVQTISYTIDPEAHRRLGNRQDELPVNPKELR
jgi:prepilin-type N-terminal cleavage/methylation domain-containing protein/prepilin-type processing-associated H-X9-DG protein